MGSGHIYLTVAETPEVSLRRRLVCRQRLGLQVVDGCLATTSDGADAIGGDTGCRRRSRWRRGLRLPRLCAATTSTLLQRGYRRATRNASERLRKVGYLVVGLRNERADLKGKNQIHFFTDNAHISTRGHVGKRQNAMAGGRSSAKCETIVVVNAIFGTRVNELMMW